MPAEVPAVSERHQCPQAGFLSRSTWHSTPPEPPRQAARPTELREGC